MRLSQIKVNSVFVFPGRKKQYRKTANVYGGQCQISDGKSKYLVAGTKNVVQQTGFKARFSFIPKERVIAKRRFLVRVGNAYKKYFR